MESHRHDRTLSARARRHRSIVYRGWRLALPSRPIWRSTVAHLIRSPFPNWSPAISASTTTMNKSWIKENNMWPFKRKQQKPQETDHPLSNPKNAERLRASVQQAMSGGARERKLTSPPLSPTSDQSGFDSSGFIFGLATGVPISPAIGISAESMIGASLHSNTPAPDNSCHTTSHHTDTSSSYSSSSCDTGSSSSSDSGGSSGTC
jgi:hypothetical protein